MMKFPVCGQIEVIEQTFYFIVYSNRQYNRYKSHALHLSSMYFVGYYVLVGKSMKLLDNFTCTL